MQFFRQLQIANIIVALQRSVSRLSQHLQNLKILFRRIGHVKLHTSKTPANGLHYGDALSCATCRVYKRSQKSLYRLKPPHPPFFNSLKAQTVLDLMLISRWKTNSSPPLISERGNHWYFFCKSTLKSPFMEHVNPDDISTCSHRVQTLIWHCLHGP